MSAYLTLKTLGRFVSYHGKLAKHVGGVNPAVLLCYFVYLDDKASDLDLGVYKSMVEIEEDTGLSEKEQRSSRDRLKELGLIEETHVRSRHRIYYKINMDSFDALIVSVSVDSEYHLPSKHLPKRKEPPAQKEGATCPKVSSSIDTYKPIDTTESAFDILWSAGMVKVNRKKSLQLFTSIVKKQSLDAEQFAKQLSEDIKKRLASRQLGFDAMHPTTYLNNERWNDAVVQNTNLAVRGQSPTQSEDERQAINDEAYNRLFGDDFQGETIDV